MNLILNSNTPWACLRDPNKNLVYWIHSKCACSFYKKIFSILNWEEITVNDINWENDIVFSYIRDPLVKHRTGIIEWFYYNRKQSLLDKNKDNNDFFKMLSNIAWLDWHSMPISEHLDIDKINKIIWIPIDVPEIDHVQTTLELLDKHTIVSNEDRKKISQIAPVNVSAGFKNLCKQRLLDIAPSPMITKSIAIDQWVYDQVAIKNFEPKNYSKYIEQLKKSGLTQSQAEEQADKDVESGEFLNWKINNDSP